MSRIAPNKPGQPSSTARKNRTDDLRREIGAAMGGPWQRASKMFESRGLVFGLLIWGGFVVLVSLAVVWSREQPNVAEGRVMSRTRIARAEFKLADTAATEQAQNNARARTARVYVPIPGALDELCAVARESARGRLWRR